MYAPPAIDTPNTARLGNASGKSTADESRPASPVITAARDPPLKIEKPGEIKDNGKLGQFRWLDAHGTEFNPTVRGVRFVQ